MKKYLCGLCLCLILSGCSGESQESLENRDIPQFESYEEVTEFLIEGNELYQEASVNSGDISAEIREETTEEGQAPYATILTCSDSRVTPEHIFSAGIGELFVIRNAGNVVSDFELGSIEYAADHLGTKLIVILGHENCGAVAATLEGHSEGYISTITHEISLSLEGGESAEEAQIANVKHSIEKCMESEILSQMLEAGDIAIVGAIYDTETGAVYFLDDADEV